MQQQIMQQQDHELDHMEKTVISTKVSLLLKNGAGSCFLQSASPPAREAAAARVGERESRAKADRGARAAVHATFRFTH